MKFKLPFENLLPKLLLNFGFWTLISVLSSSAYYFDSANQPWQGSQSLWIRMFFLQLPVWYLWGIITLMIFYLTEIFPVERHGWASIVGLHLGLSFVWLFFYSILVILNGIWQYDIPWANARQFAQRIMGARSYLEYFFYWMIFAVAYCAYFYRRSRERAFEAARLQLRNAQLENLMSVTQLQTLKAQLQPHFLFNTLNSIAALIRKDEKVIATNMLAALSDLLRHSMDNDKSHLVTLEDELDFIKRYLEIQQIRFKDLLTVEVEVSEEASQALIPSMLLQPLVENSIRHGIAEHIQSGKLGIYARNGDNRLQIEIYNDGNCLSKGWSIEKTTGLGLSNTIERLRVLYSDEFQFTLENVETRGVRAKLVIPFETENAAIER